MTTATVHDSHVTAWRDCRYGQARRFLQQLDPEAEAFTFQTFDDTPAKQRELARVVHGDFDGLAEMLDEQQKWRAGVFVTVAATDGRGRQTHNVKRVRAAFVDLDGAPLGPVLEAGLAPHIIVESSPGKWHCYWLTDDCPLDQFERVQRALARRFGGDPSVHDLPRVMRLPGFRHFKHDACATRLHDELGGNGPPYALAEIVGTLRLDLDAPLEKPSAQPNGDGGKIGPGNRHSHLFALGRSMARRSTPEAVRAALAAENQARCSPPLEDCDIDYLAARAFDAKDARNWQDRPPPGAFGPDIGEGQSATPDATASDSKGKAWPEPQPLAATVQPEPYPLDALPDVIRAAVDEVQGFTKAPVPMVASSALAALSLAVQAHYDVQRADKLEGPSALYLLTIADSGERKSTCDGFFTKAIRDYEEAQAEAAKPILRDYAAAIEAWEAKRGGVKDKIRQLAKSNKPTASMESALRDLEYDKPEAPRVPRLLYADATPEALAYGLAKQWPSGGVVSAEAGIVFGSHGMGKDSVMRNLGLLNQLWDGTAMTVDRKSSESFAVRGARLTIALQVQEPTLREFFDRAGALARGTGFLARFLLAWPESTQGFRPFTEAPPNWPHLAAFNGRIAALLADPAPIQPDGSLAPVMLALAPEAKAAWIAFHDEIEVKLRRGGELHDVRDVASKTADNAARLAALFHVYSSKNSNNSSSNISEDHFTSASRIAAWHLHEALRFFGELALPKELANAVRLNRWLIEHCRRNNTRAVLKNHVRQYGSLRDGAALDAAIRELAGLDRVRLDKVKRQLILRLNPALGVGAGTP